MQLKKKINNRTPVINEKTFMANFLDQYKYDSGQTITLAEKHLQITDDILNYTNHISKCHRTGEWPYIKRVMRMSPSMSNSYWEKIKTSKQVMGPRAIRTKEDMLEVTRHSRGNYAVLSNVDTEEILFVWAPVIESTEAFSRHWNIFRYCFEKRIIPHDNTSWKLWSVGETSNKGGKRTRGGEQTIQINHYSGSYRQYIDETLNDGELVLINDHDSDDQIEQKRKENYEKKTRILENHYDEVIQVLAIKYNTRFAFSTSEITPPPEVEYEDLEIDCPLIPSLPSDFKKDSCYQYNELPGTLRYFDIYSTYTKNLTFEQLYSNKQYHSMMLYGMNVKIFGDKMTELSRV